MIKTILEALSHEKSYKSKIKSLIQYLKYYNNLKIGIKTSKIYNNLQKQNLDLELFFHNIKKDDNRILKSILKDDIESFLSENKLESNLDFRKKIGMSQIGYNSIFIEKLSPGLWTTGKAVFFIPCKINTKNKIIIELFNIPPITVTIGTDQKKIKQVFMPKLTSKKIQIEISHVNSSKIIELFITTDKLWKPNVILQKNISIAVGVCIKSIQVFS